MPISKDFLWDTLDSVVAELERIEPQSVVAARTRGLLDARSMSTALQGDRHPRSRKAERDDKIASLYLSGVSIESVAQEIGCAPETVSSALERRGVKARQPGEAQKTTARKRDDERIERIRTMRADGKSITEIGNAEGVTRERIRQICKRAGIDTSKRPLKPEEQAAVDDYLATGSIIEVAERHNIGRHRLKTWLARAGHNVPPEFKRRQRDPKTLADAERAAQLYTQGQTTTQIAEALGRAQPTIYRLLAIAGVSPNRRRHQEISA